MSKNQPWMERVDTDPWSIVVHCLGKQARSEAHTEDELEALEFAGGLLVISTLVNAGVDFDAACDMFEERDHTYRFTYEAEDDSFGIEVTWDDGTVMSSAAAVPDSSEGKP